MSICYSWITLTQNIKLLYQFYHIIWHIPTFLQSFVRKNLLDWPNRLQNLTIPPKFNHFLPPWNVVEHFLSIVAVVILTNHVVPMCGSIPKLLFKVEWKWRLALASLWRTVEHPCTAMAHELLQICRELQGRYKEVEVSLLVAHRWTWPSLRGVCLRAMTEISARHWRFLMAFPLYSLEPSAEWKWLHWKIVSGGEEEKIKIGPHSKMDFWKQSSLNTWYWRWFSKKSSLFCGFNYTRVVFTKTVFEIFLIFTKMSPLWKWWRFSGNYCLACIVKTSFYSSDDVVIELSSRSSPKAINEGFCVII